MAFSETKGCDSRVLLLRNLNRSVCDGDIHALLEPLVGGVALKLFFQSSAGQAFVEFPCEEMCKLAHEYLCSGEVTLKGSVISATYSNKDRVTTNEDKKEGFKVILASVTHLLYPVDIDLIHYLFSKYGSVCRIVTFSKTPSMFQALIEFADSEQAKCATKQLHNRNIYDGCNVLQIQPSRLNSLTVKTNCSKSWDYTSESQYSGIIDYNNDSTNSRLLGGGGGTQSSSYCYPYNNCGILTTPNNNGVVAVGGPNNSGGFPNNSNQLTNHFNNNPNNLLLSNNNQTGCCGSNNNTMVSNNLTTPTCVGTMNTNNVNNNLSNINNHHRLSMTSVLNSNSSNINPHHHSNSNSNNNIILNPTSSHVYALFNSIVKMPREIRELALESVNTHQTPVIICYNLYPGVTVQNLFALFSLYGVVNRAKIFRDRADTALIQFNEPFYASVAYTLLNNTPMKNVELQISFSKNVEVKLPSNNNVVSSSGDNSNTNINDNNSTNIECNKTRSFSLRDQRYGTLTLQVEMERFVRSVCRPTNTLFIANLSSAVSQPELLDLFADYGKPTKIQFRLPKEGSPTQIALFQMASVSDALIALMSLHNTLLHDRNIKISFSRTVL